MALADSDVNVLYLPSIKLKTPYMFLVLQSMILKKIDGALRYFSNNQWSCGVDYKKRK
jgi:hypothetical protein